MDKPQIVKYKAGKNTFEVLTKTGTVLKFRKGQLGSLDNVLLADEVFKNHNKGERASAAELKEAFGTENVKEILQTIVEKGELQLTEAERKEAIEKKRREIVTYLNKYFVDPKTKTPHPITRIENALEAIKARIDPDIPTDRQIADLLKKLPGVISLKKQEVEGTLFIPHQYIGQTAGVMQRYVRVTSDKYDDKGCHYGIAMVPGDYNALLNELNNITKGDFNFEIENVGVNNDDSSEKKGAKKGGKNRK
jgi:ribosome maturation protein SDO1